jgi:hypothetical protein
MMLVVMVRVKVNVFLTERKEIVKQRRAGNIRLVKESVVEFWRSRYNHCIDGRRAKIYMKMLGLRLASAKRKA